MTLNEDGQRAFREQCRERERKLNDPLGVETRKRPGEFYDFVERRSLPLPEDCLDEQDVIVKKKSLLPKIAAAIVQWKQEQRDKVSALSNPQGSDKQKPLTAYARWQRGLSTLGNTIEEVKTVFKTVTENTKAGAEKRWKDFFSARRNLDVGLEALWHGSFNVWEPRFFPKSSTGRHWADNWDGSYNKPKEVRGLTWQQQWEKRNKDEEERKKKTWPQSRPGGDGDGGTGPRAPPPKGPTKPRRQPSPPRTQPHARIQRMSIIAATRAIRGPVSHQRSRSPFANRLLGSKALSPSRTMETTKRAQFPSKLLSREWMTVPSSVSAGICSYTSNT